jgi:hypothetical protein
LLDGLFEHPEAEQVSRKQGEWERFPFSRGMSQNRANKGILAETFCVCEVPNGKCAIAKPDTNFVLFPYPRILMAACVSVLVVWASVGIFLVMLLVASIVKLDEQTRAPALVTMFVLILAGVVGLLLALYLKCPACSRRILIQTYDAKSDKARTKWKLDYWAFVVIDVLLRGSFVCMYCGTKSFLSNTPSKSLPGTP